jgi:hypothetical protein
MASFTTDWRWGGKAEGGMKEGMKEGLLPDRQLVVHHDDPAGNGNFHLRRSALQDYTVGGQQNKALGQAPCQGCETENEVPVADMVSEYADLPRYRPSLVDICPKGEGSWLYTSHSKA